MKQSEKTKKLALTIIKEADNLGMKDSAEMIEAIGLATLVILGSVSAHCKTSYKDLVRLYTEQLNKNT